MLNADLQLSNNATPKAKGNTKNANDDGSAGFHFIAFVPVDGQIWKLDGLERQPQKVCTIEKEDWIYQTKPQIEARMAEYEEGQIEFSILSLVKAPLAGLVSDLAQNVKTLSALSAQVQAVTGSSGMMPIDLSAEQFCFEPESVIYKADPVFGLTQDMINQAEITTASEHAIQSEDMTSMAKIWTEMTAAQAGIRSSILEEQESDKLDQERADSRRFDYGAPLHNVIRILAKKRFFRASNTR